MRATTRRRRRATQLRDEAIITVYCPQVLRSRPSCVASRPSHITFRAPTSNFMEIQRTRTLTTSQGQGALAD